MVFYAIVIKIENFVPYYNRFLLTMQVDSSKSISEFSKLFLHKRSFSFPNSSNQVEKKLNKIYIYNIIFELNEL